MTLYTEGEAGAYLGGKEHPIPRTTMQYWRVIGKGPKYVKFGRFVRYTQDALDQFIENQTRQSTSEAA